ncbi:MAG: UDP-N-acetylmuramate--L-alanine ligase [Clostridia bacterium]|nr:UDP-N-acetylmuramate--L-alanine ligase [Clostridia bacterium]
MATENTHLGAERIDALLQNCKSIFFIGIGGINMSSLAHLTHRRGYRVGGSDRTRTALTERLAAEGIQVLYAHDRTNVADYDAVVYTVAISPDNPEYQAARERGIPCISRADYLGYLMTGYQRRIGIAGMHGKSSCTSMCAQALIEAGADPTVLSGAELSVMNGAYRVGGQENFVFEACEYMDSFLDFNPTVAVILNIEMDHVDYFKSMEQIRASYARYAALTGDGGYAVYNGDDGEVCCALEEYRGNRITFGIEAEDVDFRAVRITSRRGRYAFDVLHRGEIFCHVQLSVTGYHHIYNALATVAVCHLCGVTPEKIESGLLRFSGARRRMEWKGTLGGADVYDDYGHHPTEIRATLEGARGIPEQGGRLFCVYQPHTYSRTAALFEEFSTAFAHADRVLLVDIYAARETDTLGVSSEKLANAIGIKATYAGDVRNAADLLCREVREGDAVVVMGAGDVYRIFSCLPLQNTGKDERDERM